MTERCRCLGFTLALAAGLAACGGRIWLDHDTPQSVELHWYTGEASIDEAGARANRHCQTWGKQGVLLEEFEDQDVTTARYACR